MLSDIWTFILYYMNMSVIRLKQLDKCQHLINVVL